MLSEKVDEKRRQGLNGSENRGHIRSGDKVQRENT